MIEPTHDTRPIKGLLAGTVGLVAIMMAFGVSKKAGWLDPDTARRGAAVMLGLMLAVVGNFVPKMRLFEPANKAAGSTAVDRFAGWVFVLAGLAFAALWLFAPIERAMLGTSLVGIAGFLLVMARWLAWRKAHTEAILPDLNAERALLLIFLGTLFWNLGTFFADAVWGDAVSQWMAIVFAILLVALAPLLALKLSHSAGR